MNTFYIVIKIMIICLGSYFLLALNIIHFVNMFKFYIPFSNEMVTAGIYKKDTHRQLLAGRYTSLIISTVFISGALVWLSVITLPVGPIAAAVSVITGIIRYRRLIGITPYNIKRFAQAHSVYIIDKDKFSAYIKKNYSSALEKL